MPKGNGVYRFEGYVNVVHAAAHRFLDLSDAQSSAERQRHIEHDFDWETQINQLSIGDTFTIIHINTSGSHECAVMRVESIKDGEAIVKPIEQTRFSDMRCEICLRRTNWQPSNPHAPPQQARKEDGQ